MPRLKVMSELQSNSEAEVASMLKQIIRSTSVLA